MKQWFLGLIQKRDWRLVKEVDTKFEHVRTTAITKEATSRDVHDLTYYLYEDQHGNRTIAAVDTMRGDLVLKKLGTGDIIFRLDEYRKKIKPWLDGRMDPEIPTYDKVPQEDFRNSLAGKKV